MSKDLFHEIVKAALKKDGWIITHDPYELRVGGVEMYIDLGAEQLIAAERDQVKIAIEIKSFIGPSSISDFHQAHGQFLDYRYALEEEDPERLLYLAVPLKIHRTFFSLRFIQTVVQRSQLNLIVYDPEQETIVLWNPQISTEA